MFKLNVTAGLMIFHKSKFLESFEQFSALTTGSLGIEGYCLGQFNRILLKGRFDPIFY